LRSNLSDAPPALVAAIDRVRPRLGSLASSLVHLSVTASTNDVALARCAGADDVEGLVVVADEQTAGRGRRGHSWFSPPAAGLYVSVVLTPGRARTDAGRPTSLLTLAAGVGIGEGIVEVAGIPVTLKWPNDVLVARRKLAGILADAAGSGIVVLGYGINVAASAFPPELAGRVTSLESELGRPVDRFAVLAATLAGLAARYDDLLAGRFDAVLGRWRELAPSAAGARVSWTTNSGTHTGVTAGLADDGALLVDVGATRHRIVGGEVVWLPDS
jgi:BirA family biotin operon repressor/biotin-[acetyl-CoA-carboxylase] ligase